MEHHSVKSAETLNPVYSCGNIPPKSKKEVFSSSYGGQLRAEAASSECDLYESYSKENVYCEPDASITYDYANPDETVSRNSLYGNI